MAADDAGERTEQPTPRRRQESREQGQVPRSTDLTAAIVLLTGLVLLNVFGPGMYVRMLTLTQDIGRMHDPGAGDVLIWVRRAALATAGMLWPFLSILLVVSLAGAFAQSGPVFTFKRLQPKLENISPIKGLKRIFSTDALTRTLMGLLKMALVGVVAFVSIRDQVVPVLSSSLMAPLGVVHFAATIVFSLALRMALILLILGLLDYFYQRWKVEKGMRMTKQEVKDELKRMEGDPLLKQRRRQAQMRLAMQRIATEVPHADVVVTNPTEFAVALRYDQAEMSAPRVVAKGVDFLALRIRQIAQQHGVPVVQRPPLARALHAAVEVGQEVPPKFYRAVAEVLAYVYQLSGKAAG
ncbi:MAG: flagellar biosynthesis protein FlhB [Planctomycetota bacterium]|nr:MAG: flagellar biosynthesis protein FlhB [Planctomycetota bacterium]